MKIYLCCICGNDVTSDQLASGHGKHEGNKVYCGDCHQGSVSMPVQTTSKKLSKRKAANPVKSGRSSRVSTKGRVRPSKSSSMNPLVLLGVVVVAAIGILILAKTLSSDNNTPGFIELT